MKALKKADRRELEEAFGVKPSTSVLITILAVFPELLMSILEMIKIWKEYKAKTKSDNSEESNPEKLPMK